MVTRLDLGHAWLKELKKLNTDNYNKNLCNRTNLQLHVLMGLAQCYSFKFYIPNLVVHVFWCGWAGHANAMATYQLGHTL